MSRRVPADGRARAGGGDAPGRRERIAPVELRSLDLLNGVRRQPLGYNKPMVQALPYSTIPRVCEVEIVTVSNFHGVSRVTFLSYSLLGLPSASMIGSQLWQTVSISWVDLWYWQAGICWRSTCLAVDPAMVRLNSVLSFHSVPHLGIAARCSAF